MPCCLMLGAGVLPSGGSRRKPLVLGLQCERHRFGKASQQAVDIILSTRPAEGARVMMCEGCTADEHWRCGMQTWCECECDGSIDWGMLEIDPDEGLTLINPDE